MVQKHYAYMNYFACVSDEKMLHFDTHNLFSRETSFQVGGSILDIRNILDTGWTIQYSDTF